jgi:hypothetical protein
VLPSALRGKIGLVACEALERSKLSLYFAVGVKLVIYLPRGTLLLVPEEVNNEFEIL